MDNLNELFGQVGICERASLVAQTVESACNAGDPGSIAGSGSPPKEGNGNSFQYSEKSHRQRSLAGYTPQRVRHN